jgi:hypothetical protein
MCILHLILTQVPSITSRSEATSIFFPLGWVAECHRCGKLGKFRNVFEGRPFQHSTGDGKYCGYFRLNPRKMGTPAPSPIAPLAVPEPSQSIPIAPEISPDVESSPTLDALPDFPPTTAA